MTSYFKELFEYNAHVNRKLLVVLAENPELIHGKSHQLFSHILNAHHIWNHRIMAKPEMYGVWELQPASEMHHINTRNLVDSMHILDHLDINTTVSYQNSKGQKFQNSISDMLFHVINHSTYHRGQIATDFRANGIEPLITDYIFWKRKAGKAGIFINE